MTELVRRAYVDAAEELIADQAEKVLTTKVCVMTGLYRKEVIRLRNLPEFTEQAHDEKYNRSARVITGWLRDADFHDADGKPAVLKLQGPDSFGELIKRYSGDMAPTAMREELERLSVIALTDQRHVKLLTTAYVASSDTDGVQILGSDTADLIDTISHNIESKKEDCRFQRKVSYVNIPAEHVEPFRSYAAEESQKLLEQLDRWLAKHDKKKSTDKHRGSRVGIGIYHFEKLNPPNATDKEES